jgi:hypothetical protein
LNLFGSLFECPVRALCADSHLPLTLRHNCDHIKQPIRRKTATVDL